MTKIAYVACDFCGVQRDAEPRNPEWRRVEVRAGESQLYSSHDLCGRCAKGFAKYLKKRTESLYRSIATKSASKRKQASRTDR